MALKGDRLVWTVVVVLVLLWATDGVHAADGP